MWAIFNVTLVPLAVDGLVTYWPIVPPPMAFVTRLLGQLGHSVPIVRARLHKLIFPIPALKAPPTTIQIQDVGVIHNHSFHLLELLFSLRFALAWTLCIWFCRQVMLKQTHLFYLSTYRLNTFDTCKLIIRWFRVLYCYNLLKLLNSMSRFFFSKLPSIVPQWHPCWGSFSIFVVWMIRLWSCFAFLKVTLG